MGAIEIFSILGIFLFLAMSYFYVNANEKSEYNKTEFMDKEYFRPMNIYNSHIHG